MYDVDAAEFNALPSKDARRQPGWLSTWHVLGSWHERVAMDRVDAVSCGIVTMIGLLDLVLSLHAPFSMPLTAASVLCGAAGVAGVTIRLLWPARRASNYVFCGAMWFAFPELGARLSYLVADLAPLRDDLLVRLDVMLGFDWTGYAHFVAHQEWSASVLQLAYLSYFVQPVLSMAAFIAGGNTRRNSDLLSTVLIGLVLTVTIWAAFPAYDAWDRYGIQPPTPGNVDMHRLRSGAGAESFTSLNGVICFPSFHTVMGVLVVRAHYGRRTFWPFACLNVLMLLSIPICGAHYAVDVLGGLVVAGAAIPANRALRAWCEQDAAARGHLQWQASTR